MGLFDSAVNDKKATAAPLKKTVDEAIKKSGSARTLVDNKETILKAVKRYEELVNKGKFGSAERARVLSKVREKVTLSGQDTSNLKRVLNRISEKPPISRARIRRADEGGLGEAHLAGQTRLANDSGLSGVASPGITRPDYQAVASISQLVAAKGAKRGSAMDVVRSGPKKGPATRPPMIPLSR